MGIFGALLTELQLFEVQKKKISKNVIKNSRDIPKKKKLRNDPNRNVYKAVLAKNQN